MNQLSGYGYSCRVVNIGLANSNVPRVSIEAKMGIFTWKNSISYSIFQGILD